MSYFHDLVDGVNVKAQELSQMVGLTNVGDRGAKGTKIEYIRSKMGEIYEHIRDGENKKREA